MVMARWVNGYPAEDFVHNLPGQPPVWFRQYAGYVDVDVKAGRSLFYYFVEANDDADKKPLTLWLNGGPGCSSIGGGAFSELGPFFPRGDGRRLRVNHKSWNRVSNLLFVDSPAGVGFSYSNTTSDYNTGDEKTANDMLRFLLGWFEKFPEFKSRKLYLAGESYAGHYIPQLAVVLLNHNKQSKDFIFRLQGVALGNPLLKVRRDAPSTFEYFWSHGMLSDELGLKFRKECDFSGYVYSSDDNNLTKPCLKALDEAYKCVGNFVDAYDVILDVCYPKIAQQMLRLHKIVTKKSMGVDVCIKEENDFYFNLPKVQKAFHANRTKLPHKWSMCDKDLNYSEIDGDRDITKLLKEIIQTDIRVLVYSGDQDSVISLLGTRRNVREVAESLKFNITSPYTPWFHKQQIGGWTTEYGDMLTFATVRAASHLVPYSQPSRALALFKSFVRGVKLPNKTHADPSSDS